MKKTLLIISFLLNLGANAQIYVDASATGANNGSSWTNAYTNLQTALANDANGSNIWIAAGTYTPGNSITSLFNLDQSNVNLYGGFNGTENTLFERDPSSNITILSGDLNGDDTGVDYTGVNRVDNAARVLVVNGVNCLIDGITISGGHGIGQNNTVEEGSAVYLNDLNFTIRNCVIRDNVVSRGGVIRAIDKQGTLQIENTIIDNNLGEFAPVLYARSSGLLNVNLNNCLITNNIKRGGGSSNIGIMWLRQDTNNTLRTRITNCTIASNEAYNSPAPVVINASKDGSSVNDLTVVNSIFQDNVRVTATNNIAMTSIGNGTSANAANLYAVSFSIDESAFANIQNNGTSRVNINNLNTDPLFISNSDFTLMGTSPAIDAGDNSSIPAGTVTDLAGNNRVFGTNVDIGAYEFGSTPLGPIFVDANATGANDGTSWSDAFQDLTVALASARTNRAIWIAAGTYTPGTARTNSFALNAAGIALYGGFDGTETMLSQRDPAVNITTLSGDLNGNDGSFVSYNGADRSDNSIRIMRVIASNCTIDGLTISGGHANDNSSNAQQEGAAITLNDGNFTINNCIIEKNAVLRGGVIQAMDRSGILTINKTIMRDNLGRFAPLLYARAANADFTINVSNSLFSDNNKVGIGTTDNIGFFWFRQDNSSRTLAANFTNCTIVNNTVNISGTNSVVISASRSSSNNASAQLGIYNCIFNGNDNITTNTSVAINSVGNGTSQNAATIYEVRNSLDENAFTNIANNGTTRINVNNLSANAMFIGATNYTLQSSSPAIDAGDNNFTIQSSDLAGNLRIANNTVDMGAYEFGSTAGLDDFDQLAIQLYPNPARDILNIIVENSAFAKAEIYNLQGQKITESNKEVINVQDLKQGIYLIRITMDSGAIRARRFLKN